MRNKILKIALLFVALFMMTGLAFAADVTITTKGGSATEGQTVTVTVTVSGTASVAVFRLNLKYDANIAEFVSDDASKAYANGGKGNIVMVDDIYNKSKSYTLKFKAKKAGTTKLSVSVNAGEILDTNGNDMKVKKSEGSITVTAPRQPSTDCTLASLTGTGLKLNTAFNKNTLNYTGSVGPDVANLKLYAKATSPYAKVSVSGTNLKVGTNTVKILVTAESGATKTYTITVTRPQATPTPSPTATPIPTNTPTPTPGIMTEAKVIEKDGDGKVSEKLIKLQLEDTLTATAPEGFEKDSANILGIMVDVYKQPESGMVLVELSDKQLYIYDGNEKSFTLFRVMGTIKRNFMVGIAPADKVPAGYTLCSEEVDGTIYPAYKKDDSDFLIMYVDEGTWYNYDRAEHTLQRRNEDDKPVIITVIPEPSPMPVVTGKPESPTEAPQEITPTGERTMPEESVATESSATKESGEKDGSKKDKAMSIFRIIAVALVFLLAITFMCLYAKERKRSYDFPEINEEEISKAVSERLRKEKEEASEENKEENGTEKTEEEVSEPEKTEAEKAEESETEPEKTDSES